MRRSLLILPAAAAAVALAGCGGYAAGSPAGAPASTAATARHAVVKTRHGRLGTFLTDGRGRTLYLFRRDTGPRSHCTGACAVAWPPLSTRERPEAEGGAKASLLSTMRRADGRRQVVYHGHPLHRFEPDTAPGQTGGQGVSAFGARWYVVSPAGQPIMRAASSAPGTSYGY